MKHREMLCSRVSSEIYYLELYCDVTSTTVINMFGELLKRLATIATWNLPELWQQMEAAMIHRECKRLSEISPN